MVSEIDAEINALVDRTESLGALRKFASRAFVIEFAGTPKAGKSTSVEAIRHFFSRHGFTVHVLVERASVCPIPMKGHLFFNTWCAATMLAELIANVDTETDIIIVDRGLFDALVWLTLQRQRGELTPEEACTIERFLLLERWRKLIDLAVVMNVDADEAMERENSTRIIAKDGSIMTRPVLSAITAAVSQTVRDYGDRFGGVIEHATSGETPKQSNVRLANQIVERFKKFLDPHILVVTKAELVKLPWENGGAFTSESMDKLAACITKHGRFIPRSQAEQDTEVVQIIGCGVLSYNDEIFLFARKERDPKYRLFGHRTIWQGCHVAEDNRESGLNLVKHRLLERISSSLFLSRTFPLTAIGYCWDRNNDESKLHFGVIFKVDIDNDHTAADLRKKEFRRTRGHGLAGGFVSIADLTNELATLETWSRSTVTGALKRGCG